MTIVPEEQVPTISAGSISPQIDEEGPSKYAAAKRSCVSTSNSDLKAKQARTGTRLSLPVMCAM